MSRKIPQNCAKPMLTPFMVFAGENRQRIWEKYQNANHTVLGKAIVDEWEALSTADRSKYEEISYEDAARRDRARMIINAESERKFGVKKKKKKDPNAPKAPSVPYMFFFKEMRPYIKAQHLSASFGELGKLIGAAWRNLPEEEKQRFNRKAEEDKMRYHEEMIKYENESRRDDPNSAVLNTSQVLSNPNSSSGVLNEGVSSEFAHSSALGMNQLSNPPSQSIAQMNSLPSNAPLVSSISMDSSNANPSSSRIDDSIKSI